MAEAKLAELRRLHAEAVDREPLVDQAFEDAKLRMLLAFTLQRSDSPEEQHQASELSLEASHYIWFARLAAGLETREPPPALSSQLAAGEVRSTATSERDGVSITKSPSVTSQTPFLHPGGRVGKTPVPQGWYSTPWWFGAGSTGAIAALYALYQSDGVQIKETAVELAREFPEVQDATTFASDTHVPIVDDDLAREALDAALGLFT